MNIVRPYARAHTRKYLSQELFERDADFAAAPDTFPPDRFNAGVLVVRPSRAVYDDMMAKVTDPCACDSPAVESPSFLSSKSFMWRLVLIREC